MTIPSPRTCRGRAKSPRSWLRSGLTWSCNSRANLDYDTIKFFKDSGLRLFLVGYESGNEQILKNIKKGVTTDEMRRFTKSCQEAGVVIHGTFILGLPVETQAKPSSRLFVSPRNWMCSVSRLASPLRIPAPSFSRWPGRMAGLPKRTKPTSWKRTGSSRAPSNIPA